MKKKPARILYERDREGYRETERKRMNAVQAQENWKTEKNEESIQLYQQANMQHTQHS